MVKSASAPHSSLSVARQRGAEPPPHSSEKSTFVPSLLNVAECQNDMFGSRADVDADRMRRFADVEQQAEARARAAGQTDLRIHRDVVALIRTGRRSRGRGRRAPAAAAAPGAPAAPARRRTGTAGAAAPRQPRRRPHRQPPERPRPHRRRLRDRHAASPRDAASPLDAPHCAAATGRSWKMRGELTIAAFAGSASGTLMTSSRNRAEFGSFGAAVRAARQLVRRPDAGRARDVDVDVVLVARLRHDRVRVRSAAGLHARDELRILRCSLMSKMRMPRTRSLLTGSGHAAEPAVGCGCPSLPTT